MKLKTPQTIHVIHPSALLLTALALLALFAPDSAAQRLNQDPGHREYLTVGGMRFSSPNGFASERRQATEQFVYIPHPRYDLGLFVAVPERTVNSEYINNLASRFASYLFPNEPPRYAWKQLEEGYRRVSRNEEEGGMIQGFNGQQRVLMQYRQLDINGKRVIVGYAFGLGRGNEARALFERNLGGDSMPGWFAQAHIIASLTGERYEEINPGTVIYGRPAPRRN